jgi:hypothetical protein
MGKRNEEFLIIIDTDKIFNAQEVSSLGSIK